MARARFAHIVAKIALWLVFVNKSWGERSAKVNTLRKGSCATMIIVCIKHQSFRYSALIFGYGTFHDGKYD